MDGEELEPINTLKESMKMETNTIKIEKIRK